MMFRRLSKQEVLHLNPDGFWCGGAPEQHIRWADVVEIVAYKEDLLAVDDIRLGFRLGGQSDYFAISEDLNGFNDLLEMLPAHFPGIRTDWFGDVAFPAFAENWTVIWTKNSVG
jgi:hypothetical protein